jgi:protein-disulfide isomerase
MVARDVLPTLEKRYVTTGQLQLVFENLPLPMHAYAQKAAVAAECANEQRKFWQMHDGLFANQNQLDDAGLHERAKAIGLNLSQFEACLTSQVNDKITRSAQRAKALFINATPTFFIGTIQADGRVKVLRRFAGAPPAPEFDAAIAAAIAVGALPDLSAKRQGQ